MMNMPVPSAPDVVIVGAGPTGLVLAIDLRQRGATVRVLDKLPEPLPWTRANSIQARSLEIVSDEKLPDENRGTKLPLLGNIAAGSPIEAVENREELDLEALFAAKAGVYVLRVRGDSMIEDHLCDGDYVVIERRENARNGEQVVALLDSGEATLKRWYKESGGKIRLQPANHTMTPRVLPADQVRVQGVVIGVLRSYLN